MAYEIETKVLDINGAEIAQKLIELGAQKIQDTYGLDWYDMRF